MRRLAAVVCFLACTTAGFAAEKLEVLYIANGMNRAGKGGAITAFQINRDNGSLTRVIGSPFGAAIIPYGLATDDGRHLFVAHPALDDDNLRVYPIRPETGRLEFEHISTFDGPNYEAERGCCPGPMLADRSGRFVYVGNTGNKTVSVFDVFPGSLALTQVSTANTRPGHFPFQLVWGYEQSILFALTDKGIAESLVHVYRRDRQKGTLTEVPSSPLRIPNLVHANWSDKLNRFVALTAGKSAELQIYSISPTGELNRSPDSLPLNDNPITFSISSSGEWAAIAIAPSLQSDATVSIYSLPPGKAPAPLASTVLPCGKLCNLTSLTFDASDRFLYVADAAQNRLFGYSFDPGTAKLQLIPGSPWDSNFQPHSLLVVEPR